MVGPMEGKGTIGPWGGWDEAAIGTCGGCGVGFGACGACGEGTGACGACGGGIGACGASVQAAAGGSTTGGAAERGTDGGCGTWALAAGSKGGENGGDMVFGENDRGDPWGSLDGSLAPDDCPGVVERLSGS